MVYVYNRMREISEHFLVSCNYRHIYYILFHNIHNYIGETVNPSHAVGGGGVGSKTLNINAFGIHI